MSEITHRKIVTFRWVCVDKDRCEQIDSKIDELVFHQSKLSSYVLDCKITGLECLLLDGKFKYAITELRNERKTLWRRVRKETEETVETVDEPVELEATNGY